MAASCNAAIFFCSSFMLSTILLLLVFFRLPIINPGTGIPNLKAAALGRHIPIIRFYRYVWVYEKEKLLIVRLYKVLGKLWDSKERL